MKFVDKLTLFEPTTTVFNQTPSANTATQFVVDALVSLNAGLTRSGLYDNFSGDAHAYISANSLISVVGNYNIDGYFAKFNGTMYRITSVSDGTAKLTSNATKFVECSLEKVDKVAI